MKMNDESPTCWHALTVEQVFAALDTSPKEISESAVAARLRLHGPNGTHGPRRPLGWFAGSFTARAARTQGLPEPGKARIVQCRWR